jgi:hypothetical protein
MIGQTISHYQIPEQIGLGRTGGAFRAYNLELDRDVAIKLLLLRYAFG